LARIERAAFTGRDFNLPVFIFGNRPAERDYPFYRFFAVLLRSFRKIYRHG
jgi:hypothetical protein